MYSLPRAPLTERPTDLVVLNNGNLFPHISGDLEVQNQGVGGTQLSRKILEKILTRLFQLPHLAFLGLQKPISASFVM